MEVFICIVNESGSYVRAGCLGNTSGKFDRASIRADVCGIDNGCSLTINAVVAIIDGAIVDIDGVASGKYCNGPARSGRRIPIIKNAVPDFDRMRTRKIILNPVAVGKS